MINIYEFDNGKNFIYNGTSSEKFYLKCFTFKTSSDSREFGVKRDLDEDDTNGYNRVLNKVKPQKSDLTLEVIKVDKANNPLNLNDDDLQKIRKWLYIDDNSYHQLILGKFSFDCIFVDGKSHLVNSKGQGSLELTFKTIDGLKHSNPLIVEMKNGDLNKTRVYKYIKNNSEVDKNTRCKFTILQRDENESDISIKSLTNDSSVIIKGLKYNETCIVDANTGEIYSLTYPEHNLFETAYKNTDDIFSLNYGLNKIEISGKCKIEMQYRCNYGL